MLNEEVAKYRELSGDTNSNVPISRIGGYLDGYEKALEQEPVLDKIRTEIIENAKCTMNDTRAEGLYMAFNIVDKYKAESEDK